MEIRKTTIADIDTVMDIFDRARAFMRTTGNTTQWVNGYPSRQRALQDIAAGQSYVVVDDTGRPTATFVAAEGEEPNYRVIEHGAWLNDLPYVTLHRMASDGRARGIADYCFRWCMNRWPNLRADTHQDNPVLLHLLAKHGFRRCGIIRVEDGTERVAFQWTAPAPVNP